MTILFTPAANAQNCINSTRCDELGYTKTAADCNGLDTLVCPFDENKVFCTKTTICYDGSILFSDKSCAAEQQSGKTAIGVVFSAASRLAVALDEKELAWGGDGEIVYAAKSSSGKSNTAAILAYGKANNISYPAAEYCNTYSTAGTKAGDWYLPSPEELKLLSSSYVVVSLKLATMVGKVTILESGAYWASSELDMSRAKALVLGSGSTKYSNKDTSYRVRPVLAF